MKTRSSLRTVCFGASVVLALAGCSNDDGGSSGNGGDANGSTDNGTTGSTDNGATGSTDNGATGSGTTDMTGGGTDMTGGGTDMGGTDMGGGTDMTGGTDTGGGTDMTGGEDMTGGDMMDDGSAGEGSTDDTTTGLDTSGFMANCMQGGDNWGTPMQAGPCAAGTTAYGVMMEYGPYGVRTEYNVGEGFESPVSPSDTASGCSGFIDGFGADPIRSADLKDTHDLDFSLYSVFYPGAWADGEKFPLITWGNGTCAMPEGYGPLLRYVASFGYIIVAANSRYTGYQSPMTRALDFMFAANDDPDSKYYQRIDTENVGAMGHSQGSSATAAASSDSRIDAVILFNGGSSASKPYLAISGDRDILVTGSSNLSNPVNSSRQPAAWIFYHMVPTMIAGQPTGPLAGHLTLMMEPDRVVDPTVAWWDMMLKGDETAKEMFLGDSCGLCGMDADFEYGHNSNLQ